MGGSSIEASRIAAPASTKMTEEYTVVQLNRQAELTRRIHSVRGFISAGVVKSMRLKVESSRIKDGQRVYRIRW
ncbi:MAG: hypothetical protein HY648_08720 [Acidobacteria bacterium]|nr:hypothetical protein [Acidobacteriota bacterium]